MEPRSPGLSSTLYARCQAGDESAWQDVYASSNNELRNWIAYRSSSHDMVDECLQQTYITFFRNLDKYDPERPLLAWLKGIAYNQIGKHLQKLKKQQPTRDLPEDMSWEAEPTESVDHGTSQSLGRCLERLSKTAKRILLARYQEGMAIKDIAIDLKKKENAVSATLARSRKALRTCMEEQAA